MFILGTEFENVAVIYNNNFAFSRTLNELIQASKTIIPLNQKKFGSFEFSTMDDLANVMTEFNMWAAGLKTNVMFIGLNEEVIFGINMISDTENYTWYLSDLNDDVGNEFGNHTVLCLVQVPIDYTKSFYNLYQKYADVFTVYSPAAYDSGFILGTFIVRDIDINKDNVINISVFAEHPAAFIQTNSFNAESNLLEYSAHNL